MNKTLIIVSLATLLAACGERAQTIGGVKQDAAAYTGTGSAFQQPGWKPGDKASWESELRARGQNSQNEYNRVN
jgi:hypothetical protein